MSTEALILIETTGLKKNLPFLGNRYFNTSGSGKPGDCGEQAEEQLSERG